MRWGVTLGLSGLLLMAGSAFALTPAGTVINNQATLTYQLNNDSSTDGSALQRSISPTASFVVQQLLDVKLLSMDATPVLVNAPDNMRALTFNVINSGNGPERFTLSRDERLTGDDFDPLLPTDVSGAIYLENGLQPGFQSSGPNADDKYIAGSNDPNIAADASQTVYVVSNIPAGLASNAIGLDLLKVTGVGIDASQLSGSVIGSTTVGNQVLEQVLGATHAMAQAIGRYKVSGLIATFDKNVVKIVDPTGGSSAIQGSTISYQLLYQLTGEGLARDVTLTDAIPSNMVYVANTLKLDGFLNTDAVDADALSVTNGIVSASLGNKAAPYKGSIEFDVKVR